jgi:hypothetical protein
MTEHRISVDDIMQQIKVDISKNNDLKFQPKKPADSDMENTQITCADSPLPREGYNARISIIEPLPSPIKVSSRFSIELKVKNLSAVKWPAKGSQDGKYQIRLAYHWLYKNNKMFIFDGLRTFLPKDVEPHEEISLKATVKAPYMSGEYILELDMLQEGVCWFKERGSETSQIIVPIERIIN